MTFLTIVSVVGVTSSTRNDPVLADSSLLYDSVAMHSAANASSVGRRSIGTVQSQLSLRRCIFFCRRFLYNGAAQFSFVWLHPVALLIIGVADVIAEHVET